ncbi:MAG: hypothetical protein IJH36_02480 [Clostridia bacterium]|nr:hypothetical protein [Clostridia bacterium]
MAKKSMKAAATAGTSVFDQLVQGVQDAENVTDAQDVQNVQSVPAARPGRPAKTTQPLERLNLKIPADIKEYLQAAAYRESSPKKTVSLTEYLCDLVRADMEKHKDD